MEIHAEIGEALVNELSYYRAQLDAVTGTLISLEYKLAEMSNEIIQLHKGLSLIAALQDFPPGVDFGQIYDHFTEQVNLQLQMDCSVMLLPVPGRNQYFSPAHLKG